MSNYAVEGVQFRATALFSFERRRCLIHNGRGVQLRRRIQSVSTVIRVFDIVSYIAPKTLPSVIAIDEFKGNTGDEKYQVILTNPQTGEILDILPTRNSSDLIK